MEGEAWIALAVRARMAFWDFLVPKARPRVERAERVFGASSSSSWLLAMAAERSVLRMTSFRAGTNWSWPVEGSYTPI